MDQFDAGVIRTFDKLAYEMYLVQQDFNIKCSCVDFTTQQAKDSCFKCLGTGNKIKIRTVMGVSQNNKASFRPHKVGESANARTYYTKGDVPIFQDNIFVNGTDVDVVLQVDPFRSDNIVPVYNRSEANSKKKNVQIFLKNFKKIIGRG